MATSATSTFDPTNPATFFNNISNLSPDYTSNSQYSQAAQQGMQDALAWLQANPGQAQQLGLDVGYLNSTLTNSLAEQQNLTGVDTQQTATTAVSDQLNQVQAIWNKIQASVSPSEIVGYATQLQQLGAIDQNVLNEVIAGNQSSIVHKFPGSEESSALVTYLKPFINSTVNNLTTQVGQNTATLGTDQANVVSGLNYAQPDYSGLSNQLAGYYGGPGANGASPTGIYASQVAPQEQNYYATAYNLKNNVTEQANLGGVLHSGATEKAQGSINQQALGQDNSLLNAYNNQKATAENNLKTSENTSQADYSQGIQSLQGQDFSTLMSGAAQNQNTAFGANANANLNSQLNNNESQIQNQAQNNAWINQLAGAGGSLAGTIAGALV